MPTAVRRDRHHPGRRDGDRDDGGGARLRRPASSSRSRAPPSPAYNGSFVITATPTRPRSPTPCRPRRTSPAGGAAITATRPRFVLAVPGPRRGHRLPLPGDGQRRDRRASSSTTRPRSAPRSCRRSDTNLRLDPDRRHADRHRARLPRPQRQRHDGGAGEPDIANVNVVVTDSNGDVQTVTTDATGNWSAVVPAGLDDGERRRDRPGLPASGRPSRPRPRTAQTINVTAPTTQLGGGLPAARRSSSPSAPAPVGRCSRASASPTPSP